MLIWVVSRSIPGESLEVWGIIKQLTGCQIFVGLPSDNLHVTDVDVIISMGITSMEETFQAVERWPTARLYCYNWDCYEWVWTRPRENEYDYRRYGELLRSATEVWVPSDCTGRRTMQWWPWVRSVHTILSAIPYWEHENVQDDGFALCCLRQLPDKWRGKFEECCEAVKIPYEINDHALPREDYRNQIASCRFICAPFYELSTGGFSLMEAYYLGKPVLLNGSQWNGGYDYFHKRAHYFNVDDEGDFKKKLLMMYHDTPKVPADHREYISETFSDRRMAEEILARIQL